MRISMHLTPAKHLMAIPIACLLSLFSYGAHGEDFAATLEWARRIELSTPVSGVVSEVNVMPGSLVNKNELLVRLDQRGFKARVALASAAVEEARQNRAEAHREMERAAELFDRTVLSDHERQKARIAAAQADAALDRAKASLTDARLALEYSDIRAPFDGIILDVSVLPGSTVVNRFRAHPIAILADNRRMKARAELAEHELSSLQLGQEVQIVIAAREIPGRITSIGHEPVESTGTGVAYRVEAEFSVPEGSTYRAGQQGRMRINDR